jgi:hypothetical protein
MIEDLSPEAEQVFRDTWREVCEALTGPRDAAAEQRDWEDFRDTRLLAIIEAGRAVPLDNRRGVFVGEVVRWAQSRPRADAVADSLTERQGG